MTVDEFRETLNADSLPTDLEPCLQALWWDAKGDWDAAHDIVKPIESRRAYRVHAYLHRVEGDLGNAGYWYRRADLPEERCSLKDEWHAIVADLLG